MIIVNFKQNKITKIFVIILLVKQMEGQINDFMQGKTPDASWGGRPSMVL